MILADTSVWVDHFRHGNADLARRLQHNEICMHPAVIAEIALGSLKDRALVIDLLQNLPRAPAASHDEVMAGIERQRLFSRGIGYVDAQLALACLLDRNISLWTFDRRLARVSEEIGLRMITS